MSIGIFGISTVFLTPGRLLSCAKGAFRRPRPVRLARGVRQPEGANWHWSWERTRICGAEPRWRRLLFPGSGGRTARVNGIVAVARVAHRSGIEMTIPRADTRFVAPNSF